MKATRIIIFSFLAVLLLSFGLSTNDSIERNEVSNVIEYDCKYDQCHATAKSTGKRCKHCVSNKGDLYCWQHK